MKQEDKKYKILFDSSMDAIMTIEAPSWKYNSVNLAALKLFNVKSEKKFISLGPWDISPEKQPDGQLSSDKAKKMINIAMQKGSNFFEWTHKTIDNKEFFTNVLLTRMEFDGKKGVQATVRDITSEKEMDKKLKQKIEELEEINRIMVGRELKMIELKEKIIELEKIIKQ